MLYQRAFPLLDRIDPERAHRLAIIALKTGLIAGAQRPDPPMLAQALFGMDFPNPIGLAAGFDKDARVFGPMLNLGFGFVEVGTVTPRPQEGNPKPRLFRLEEDRAVINRLGFNNEGQAAALKRLEWRWGKGIVGVNIGANKDSADRIADYVAGGAIHHDQHQLAQHARPTAAAGRRGAAGFTIRNRGSAACRWAADLSQGRTGPRGG